jgi:outer membrane protein
MILMKNLSLILNVILAAAVTFLYIKIFSGNKGKTTASSIIKKDSTGLHTSINNSIAYVELDSLNEKITFIKARRQDLEKEQKAIETEWRNEMTGLQNRVNAFQKKGNAITQEEAERFQSEMQQEQQKVEMKKQNATQNLTEKSYKFMDDIQKKLKDFLSDYNKDKKYQYILTTGTGMDYMLYKDESANITNEVIDGMNEIMSTKK